MFVRRAAPTSRLRAEVAAASSAMSETWSDDERRAAQWDRIAKALPEILESNAFYRRKLVTAGIHDAREAGGLADLPFTTKAELSADAVAHPPFGSNLTYPIDRYVRLHQTSGTTGRPLRVLDTADSWQWWRDCWDPIYRAAGVTKKDRIFFAFSFGPFIGFWSAFAGAEQLGALCITGAAMSSAERAAAILATEATVLMSTPTYALRLAEVAREEGIDLRRSKLRVSIHAGEPGASIPATRERIENELGVEAFDHTGATEVGAHGFSCSARDGVHINEADFVVEIFDPATNTARDRGEGELVLTNLGRWGMPAIRYRTGDRVNAVRGRCSCGRTLVKLAGGIAGRVDDMVTVRGVNVFPSAIESIVRRFAEIEEFRVELVKVRKMDELRCVVEARVGAASDLAERLAAAIHHEIGIRCAVETTAPGTLPRFEMKAKRFVKREEARA
jgi:phenylacetate-CoA ligase